MEVKSVPCTERSVPFELLEEMKTENLGGTGGSGNSCGSNSSGSSSGTNTASKMSTEDMPTTMGKQQQKKSWAELREDVRNLRRKLWTLGFRLPHSFTFRKMAGKTRIYFMASPPNSRDNSIFAVDVPHTMQGVSRFSQQPLVKFPWIQILASGFPVCNVIIRQYLIYRQGSVILFQGVNRLSSFYRVGYLIRKLNY